MKGVMPLSCMITGVLHTLSQHEELRIVKDHTPSPFKSASNLYPLRNSRKKKKQFKEQVLVLGGRRCAQVKELALKYMGGTSAILAEQKGRGRSLDEYRYLFFPP